MTQETLAPESYDVVIVGGGAAGLSAALVLGRALRRVAVVDAGSPRNAPATHMQGFLSRDGLPPSELIALGRDEARKYGVALVDGAVDDVERRGGSFVLTLADRSRLRARRILVATGLRDELPDVPGLRERFGRDVLHCPYCHGYEVRDRRIGVLGGTPGAVEHALLLRQWAADVVYFPNGDDVSEADRERLLARAVGVVDGVVERVRVEDDVLRSVDLGDGRSIERDAVFVRPRFHANDTLLASLGCAVDEQGWAWTDATGRTSVPGVWAAGNAVNPRAQVITAADEGSAAAIGLNGDLVDEDTALELAELRGQHARQDAPDTPPGGPR